MTEGRVDEGHIIQSEEDLIGTFNHSNLTDAASECIIQMEKCAIENSIRASVEECYL